MANVANVVKQLTTPVADVSISGWVWSYSVAIYSEHEQRKEKEYTVGISVSNVHR